MAEARTLALGLLAQREHTRFELQGKLRLRQFSHDVIVSLLDRLAEENSQSDTRFTEVFVHSRIAKGHGPLKITAELRSRGVAEDLITDALRPYASQWSGLLLKLYRQRFGDAALPENIKEKAKRIRFLQSRGFSGQQLKNISQITKNDIELDEEHDQ